MPMTIPSTPGGHLQRVVLDVLAGAAEDGVQQLFLGRELGLRLGRDLAHQDVARVDVGAHADDAVLIEVPQLPLADVGDVAGELLAAELRLADFEVELFDVDRGVGVGLDQLLADDDGVLEIEAVPGHECRQHVAPQRQFALVGAGAVGEDLAFLDLVAHADDRLLVLAGPLVEPHELAELVDVGPQLDVVGVDVGDHALALGADEHARVQRRFLLQAGGHQRRLAHQQRHGLALHVRAHQRPVGVVVLEEGDQPGGDADHLGRGHVDVLHRGAGDHLEIAAVAGDDRVAHQLAVLDHGVGRGHHRLLLLVRPQPFGVFRQASALELLVGGDQEAVFVDAGVDRQAGDQADVRAFGRLDGADPPVVRVVDVADLEAGPLAVQTAGPQGRQPPLVREHRQRVGLVDHLRELAAAEEILDGRGNALRVDQAARRHVLQVLEAHPLLHRPPQLQEALAQLVGGQLLDRPQAAVAEVVDVVDLPRRPRRCAAATGT